MPSWNQVALGIMREEVAHIYKYCKLGLKDDNESAIAARLSGGWQVIFAFESIPYESQDTIDINIFRDASHRLTKAVFRLYSLESFLYSMINDACLK